jgi:hypothetical protein
MPRVLKNLPPKRGYVGRVTKVPLVMAVQGCRGPDASGPASAGPQPATWTNELIGAELRLLWRTRASGRPKPNSPTPASTGS